MAVCDYCDENLEDGEVFEDGTGTYHKKCARVIGFDLADGQDETVYSEIRVGDDEELEITPIDDLVPEIE